MRLVICGPVQLGKATGLGRAIAHAATLRNLRVAKSAVSRDTQSGFSKQPDPVVNDQVSRHFSYAVEKAVSRKHILASKESDGGGDNRYVMLMTAFIAAVLFGPKRHRR